MRDINKDALIHNIEGMINALEYDSMRSSGKCKINAGALVDLHNLLAIYKKETTKPAAKPAAAKPTK